MSNENDNLKVAVRVRPFNEREKSRNAECVVSMIGNTTTIKNPTNGDIKRFTFDYSYWSHDGFIELEDGQLKPENVKSVYADQKIVFDDLGQGVLRNAWKGYNATLFAYGQTGSGKSYSMIGHRNNKGIVPITCGELFQAIEQVDKAKKEMQVTFSMLEIYNEQIRDLLQSQSNRKNSHLKIRENNKIGFYVEGLSKHPCRDYKSIEKLMDVGAINRTTASTNMNATSSRSHMVISIKFKQIFNNSAGESTTKTSEINLVDLAGSERANSSGASGDRLKEGSAINTSLLMLGTVIEKLAAGDSRTVIPYRDSALTKLLKSALGGNSKTVMIAALSPADINYEETLSTLRYANRAKNIKNKAVINESPTDRLIRELKEENARLLAQLSKRSVGKNVDNNDEVKSLLAQNEQLMKEMTTSWEQKLDAARKQWESEQKTLETKDKDKNITLPYLQNVNEDPQLTGVIKHEINMGKTVFGKCSKKKSSCHNIELNGLGILEEHCYVTSSANDKSVVIEPCQQADITVNGLKILIQTTLKHGDRLKLGSNVLFLYIGFPCERGNAYETMELVKRYDYSFFQNELLFTTSSSRDIGVLNTNSDQQNSDPVYLEYILLMPVVDCLNAMSQEMGKDVEFCLMVKNLTTCGAYGQELNKELMVKVRHQVTNQIWIWTKNKFTNRRYMIEELYMKYQDDPSILSDLPRDKDPFWDPVEDVYIGCAHVWLHSLAYRMSCEDRVMVHNHSGGEEGWIDVSIFACTPSGENKGDDLMVIDSNQLLGQRYDLVIEINRCLDVKWIKQNSTRGIMIRYKFFKEILGHHSTEKWYSVNPTVAMKEQITVESVTPTFLQYLHSAALVIEIWGLQAGRIGRPSSPQDSGLFYKNAATSGSTSSSNSFGSSSTELLEQEMVKTKNQLQALEDDNDDLQKICSILKKENAKLKKKLQSQKQRHTISSATPTRKHHKEFPPSSMEDRRPCDANRVEVELGRSLKSFFSDVRNIQKDLRNASLEDCSSENGQILEISKNLDHVLGALKTGVSNAVRLRKQEK